MYKGYKNLTTRLFEKLQQTTNERLVSLTKADLVTICRLYRESILEALETDGKVQIKGLVTIKGYVRKYKRRKPHAAGTETITSTKMEESWSKKVRDALRAYAERTKKIKVLQ